VRRALLISLSTTALLSCAAPQTQPRASVPPLRWKPHVAFTRHQTDFVGWIGLRVGDRTYRLIEHPRSSCGTLERSRYHWYDIPPDALTAAIGMLAGASSFTSYFAVHPSLCIIAPMKKADIFRLIAY
jgi:hypothetical protein